MNVRKMTQTTFSLAVLLVGLSILLPRLWRTAPYEFWFPLENRLLTRYYLSGYTLSLFSLSAWLLMAAGLLDAILHRRTVLYVLYSFRAVLCMGVLVLSFALMSEITFYIYWGLIHLITLVGVNWSFRMLARNNYPGGIKLFSFLKVVFKGMGTGKNNWLDRSVVFLLCILLAVTFVLLLISLGLYVKTYWSMFV